MHYRIGTRGSRLALIQTEYVKNRLENAYPEDTFELCIIRTKGDQVLDKPLAQIGDKGLFVSEIEHRLLDGDIDLAVHSMKDLPGEMTPGLTLAKAWEREDPRDVLILREATSLGQLREGAVIGTGSSRRARQLKELRPDLVITGIRGNVDTRLRKMEEEHMDGIVLAAAGLKRMGLTHRITAYLEPEQMVPAAAQGILGIQLREKDDLLLGKINALSSETVQAQAQAERTFLLESHADCHMAVGAYCQVEGEELQLTAVFAEREDAPLQRVVLKGKDPAALGSAAAKAIRSKGTVYLLGAGPGDPELLTIKGKRLLEEADCVVYDRLVSPALLDLAIHAKEKIYVGKADHRHTLPQDEINALLVKKALEYKTVVRLKGGDPYVFGRGGEEGIYLRSRGILCEEVPGISSAIAGPAYAGIPITHRGMAREFRVITAHDSRDRMTDVDFSTMQDPGQTLVFLMGLSRVGEIADKLMAAGRKEKTPAAVISCATTPRQKTVTGCLADIGRKVTEADLPSPALIVVGDVVSLRGNLRSYEEGLLFGKKYLVSRIGEEPSALAAILRREGAEAEEICTGTISRELPAEGLFAAEDIPSMDWIVFTGKHGVEAFFAQLEKLGLDTRSLCKARFAAVGAKTAECLGRHGLRPDLMPEKQNSAALARALAEVLKKEESCPRVWICKPQGTPDVFTEELRGIAECRTLDAYRNLPVEVAPLDWKACDAAFFTSASSVERMIKEEDRALLADLCRSGAITIYAMGPSAKAALTKRGIEPVNEPLTPSLELMAELEVNKWRNMPM